jgi:hypothetical protein
MPNNKMGKKGATKKKFQAVQKKIQKNRTGKSQFKAITPATGRTVSKPFGAGSSKQTASGAQHCWNALHPSHLALPRPVGPYTVVRLTTTFSTPDPLVIVGSFRHNSGDMTRPDETGAAARMYSENHWSQVTALSCPREEINKPIAGLMTGGSATDAARWHFYQQSGLAALKNNCQIAPAAITVQVMNQNALQTTKGLCYACVTPLEANYSTHGGGESGYNIGQNMIAFMKPRLLTLPKLSMAGVCAHSHPLDMNDISEFREIGDSTCSGDAILPSSKYTWGLPHRDYALPSTYQNAVDVSTNGWAPIMFYRPDAVTEANSDSITYQVTTEYRVRFDLSNVASATHRMHTPAPMSTYTGLIKNAVEALPGILENVAEVAGGAALARRSALALAA